jgi:AraC-like DNA-binding protein
LAAASDPGGATTLGMAGYPPRRLMRRPSPAMSGLRARRRGVRAGSREDYGGHDVRMRDGNGVGGLDFARMAAHAHMSERSFYRRFTGREGSPPLAWLRDQRIARARELLESSELAVEQIAREVGLGTSANLRLQFHRAMSLSPQEYRRRFALAGIVEPVEVTSS